MGRVWINTESWRIKIFTVYKVYSVVTVLIIKLQYTIKLAKNQSKWIWAFFYFGEKVLKPLILILLTLNSSFVRYVIWKWELGWLIPRRVFEAILSAGATISRGQRRMHGDTTDCESVKIALKYMLVLISRDWNGTTFCCTIPYHTILISGNIVLYHTMVYHG